MMTLNDLRIGLFRVKSTQNFNCVLFCVYGMLLFAEAAPVHAKIQVFAGITPGLQYIEEGEESGPVVDMVKVLFEAVELDYEIQMSNWAKTHQEFARAPHSLMFSVARFDSREQKFQWVLDVGPLDLRIARSKDRPELNPESWDALKQHKLAVVRGSTPHQLLLQSGFVEVRDFGAVATASDIMKYVGAGFVDLVFYESTISPMMLELHGYPADYLVPLALEVPVSSKLWLVASLDFPAPLIEKIRATHEKLEQDPDYQVLQKKILPLSH